MFDYKIIAYNKLGKVQETENLYCAPDEINDVMYTMSEQYGYAEALDTMDTHMGEYGEKTSFTWRKKIFLIVTRGHGRPHFPL